MIANAKGNPLLSSPSASPLGRATNLAKTKFDEFQLVGLMEAPQQSNAKNSTIVRIFEKQDGTSAMLQEWNYAADGGSVVQIKDFCNTDVRGVPATLALMKDSMGRSLWEIVWATERTQYTLYLRTSVDPEAAVSMLLGLARAIPG